LRKLFEPLLACFVVVKFTKMKKMLWGRKTPMTPHLSWSKKLIKSFWPTRNHLK
jgi:hypothetical protein